MVGYGCRCCLLGSWIRVFVMNTDQTTRHVRRWVLCPALQKKKTIQKYLEARSLRGFSLGIKQTWRCKQHAPMNCWATRDVCTLSSLRELLVGGAGDENDVSLHYISAVNSSSEWCSSFRFMSFSLFFFVNKFAVFTEASPLKAAKNSSLQIIHCRIICGLCVI